MTNHLNGASLQGCTVLVTEDEPLIALDLQQAIETAGARVVLSAALSDALQLIAAEPLSAAVIDCRLGRERSDGAIKALQARGVPFVVYTGDPIMDGVNFPIIRKPGSPDDIVAALQSLVNNG
jgi:DNA-binding NtrC family response regulator